jgi:alpha-N-arabinofuranosidase
VRTFLRFPRRALVALAVMSTTLLLVAATSEARGAGPITVTVDTAKPGPKIDRNLFGQFAEHLGKGI